MMRSEIGTLVSAEVKTRQEVTPWESYHLFEFEIIPNLIPAMNLNLTEHIRFVLIYECQK